MKSTPILMKPAMASATLADIKTHTRRCVKDEWQGLPLHLAAYQRDAIAKCPYGGKGDRRIAA